MNPFEKLKAKLAERFQLNQADLDFGFSERVNIHLVALIFSGCSDVTYRSDISPVLRLADTLGVWRDI